MSSPSSLLPVFSVLAVLAPSGVGVSQRQFRELPRLSLPARTDPTSDVVLADVDGDGDLDLLTANPRNPLQLDFQTKLLLNDGNGRFSDGTSGLPKDVLSTNSVAPGDVDGDGDVDLVLAISDFATGAPNRLYLGNGKGQFTDATSGRIPKSSELTYHIRLADFDGDGDLDFVAANFQQDRLYANDGKGVFTDVTKPSLPTSTAWTKDIATGDVDGDGDIDLVLASPARNRLYLNDGKGRFTDVTASRMPTTSLNSAAIRLVDVDGDGDLDIVVANGGGSWFSFGTGPNHIDINNGKGFFTEARDALPADKDNSIAMAAGDVDLDGDVDLLFTHQAILIPGRKLYLNNGKGTFTEATSRLPEMSNAVGPVLSALTAGDVDGDGDPEFVLGTTTQDRMYVNAHRNLYAPQASKLGSPYSLEIDVRPGYASSFYLALAYYSGSQQKQATAPFGTLRLGSPIRLLGVGVIHPLLGRATMTYSVPSDPRLIGRRVFHQALIVDSLAWFPTTWRFTNLVAETVAQ